MNAKSTKLRPAHADEDTGRDPDGYEDFDESPPDTDEECGCEDDGTALPEGF